MTRIELEVGLLGLRLMKVARRLESMGRTFGEKDCPQVSALLHEAAAKLILADGLLHDGVEPKRGDGQS